MKKHTLTWPWCEPFVELRAPMLFNLRRDPLEKAPITDLVAKLLITFKDYLASQTAGSFNLTKMQKQIEEMSKAGK